MVWNTADLMPDARSPIICLEFNELTPRLMDDFIGRGLLPNFQRLREQSCVFTTDAEAEGEWLNPWVQWVTVHSGLSAQEHGIFRLSNAFQMKTPAVWDLVSQAGQKVCVFGSMNSWYTKPLNGCLVPDPWCQQLEPYPADEFEAFYKYIQHNVQEYANADSRLSRADTLRFLRYLGAHGLRFRTIVRIVRQLVRERFGNHRWRRASLLDALQFDVFAHLYRKHQPQFSTFFLNSTAHYQHKFWRNMDPQAFQIRPTAREQRDYKDAILFGYQEMDRLVGQFLKLAPNATFLFMTAMGQRPYTKMEVNGGKRVFRLRNESALREHLGVEGNWTYEPIMADEFFLRFKSQADATRIAQHLTGFELPSGAAAFSVDPQGLELVVQCRCRELLPEGARIRHAAAGIDVDFHKVFYRVDTLKSAYHDPLGMLWIRHPSRRHYVQEEPVSLTRIAPTILHLLGIERPDFMQGSPCLTDESAPQTVSSSPAKEASQVVSTGNLN